MRAKEFLKESLDFINQDIDDNTLEGYVVNTDEPQLANYLSSQHAPKNIALGLMQKYNRIGIIKNMYVADEYRNQGIGTDLMNGAIDDAAMEGAESIVLVSDTGESNDFDLTKWYESFGFEVIGNAGGDPVMLMQL